MRLLLLIAVAFFFAPHDLQATDLALVHATVYTEPDRPPLHDATVVIRDGRIAAVGERGVRVPRGVRTIDCSGMTVTAGFWNSHVHFLPPELLNAEQKTPAVLDSQLQTMFTRWGFTTVFDLASVESNTNYIRGEIEAGKVVGPRVLTVGDPFWVKTPVYVQQYLATFHIAMPEVHSIPEARTRVDRQIREGADGVKIFAGSIEANHVEYMPLDLARAIVEEAHRDHRLVFSHPSTIKGIELSLDAGVDIVAHVTTSEEGEQGDAWPPELVARMKAARVSLIPTLTLFDVEMQKNHASAEATQQVLALAVSQLQAYASAGGEILFGTDIGYIDHYDTAEEFELMSRAGMSFQQILASLTTNPAGRFGYGSHSGRVMRGYDADVDVLRGDPAAEITALSHVAYTIRGGKVLFDASDARTGSGGVDKKAGRQ